MNRILERIRGMAGSNFPDSREIGISLKKVLYALKNESPSIRPPGSNGEPGGLLLLKFQTTIIVPDLHARTGFLESLLSWKPPFSTLPVFEALEKGRIQIVCVGDGFHSETRAVKRWRTAFEEYRGGFRKHKAMDDEMRESLGVMMMVMELKASFPDSFHFLKGNHENVANENSEDNRSFGKFVYEGAMVASWFHRFIPEDIFRNYYEFEKRLPGFAVGNGFCVTHAEPRRYHSRQELIDALIKREILYDLTWTPNGGAEEGSVAAYLEDYFPLNSAARMFGGHRTVPGRYRTRAEGKFIQIHNPDRYNVVFITDMEKFSPDKNIIILPRKGVELYGTNS